MRGYNDAMRKQGMRRYDVGVDANDMHPVTAEQIVAALPNDAEWTALHGFPLTNHPTTGSVRWGYSLNVHSGDTPIA